VNKLGYFRILLVFWPFLTKLAITWDVLYRSELVNIRWKANKHTSDLGWLEIFLKDEILGLFGKIPLKMIAILHIFSYFSTEFWRKRSKSTFFLKPRGKFEPHYMWLNHIGKRFQAKYLENRRFRKKIS